jgi:hypothetical protein
METCKETGRNGKRKNIGTREVSKATKDVANLSMKNKANMSAEDAVSRAAKAEMNKEAGNK